MGGIAGDGQVRIEKNSEKNLFRRRNLQRGLSSSEGAKERGK